MNPRRQDRIWSRLMGGSIVAFLCGLWLIAFGLAGLLWAPDTAGPLNNLNNWAELVVGFALATLALVLCLHRTAKNQSDGPLGAANGTSNEGGSQSQA